MSGEGAPETLGMLDSDGERGTQERWSNGLPVSARPLFDDYSTAEQVAQSAEATACHRGSSGFSWAASDLQASWRGVGINYQNFACSGAVVNDLLSASTSGHGGCALLSDEERVKCYRYADDLNSTSIRPQIPAAMDFLRRHRLNADAVVMSVGGNDLGFSTVIKDCLREDDCSAADSVSNAALASGRAALPGRYAELDRRFTSLGLARKNIFLKSHMNPLQKSVTGLCNGSDFGDLILDRMSANESTFATRTDLSTINSLIAGAVSAHGWTAVTSHLGSETGNSICSATPWYNNRRMALTSQGADMPPAEWYLGIDVANLSFGMFHPNTAGQRFGYAPAYKAAIDSAMRTRFKPRTPRQFRAISFASDANGSKVTFRWDDVNLSESKHVITNLTTGRDVTTRPDATEFTVDLGRDSSGVFTIKACIGADYAPVELCSDESAAITVRLVRPTQALTDLGVSTTQLVPGSPVVRASWKASQFEGGAQLYTTVEIETEAGRRSIAVEGESASVNYESTMKRLRVAACNNFGCGRASAWGDILLPGRAINSDDLPCQPPQMRTSGAACR